MNKKVLKDWHPSFAELSLHKESAVVIYSFERVREREVPSQCNLFSSAFLQKGTTIYCGESIHRLLER